MKDPVFGLDSMVKSSETFWVLASPMPAPKPIDRIQSLAVEYPGWSASVMSSMPGPCRGGDDDFPVVDFKRQDPAVGMDGNVDFQFIGGDGCLSYGLTGRVHVFERLLQLVGGPAGVFKVEFLDDKLRLILSIWSAGSALTSFPVRGFHC